MKILAVEEPDPPRLVENNYKDKSPCQEPVYWTPNGTKPSLKSKNVLTGFAVNTFDYKKTPISGKGDWSLVLTATGEHLILPVTDLWCANTKFKS